MCYNPAMPRLMIFDKSVRGVDLLRQPLVLGRSREADIPIHDKILSRKHCVIEPAASGWRVVDLKSSNGTYLNGRRVERSSLKLDDVLEIGSTVIILLEPGSSALKDARAGLRNPQKARTLVDTLSVGKPRAGANASRGVSKPARKGSRSDGLRGRRKMRAFEAVLAKWVNEELLSGPAAGELVAGYLQYKIVSLAAKHSPDLRGKLAGALEAILAAGNGPFNATSVASLIREAVARTFGPDVSAGETKP